MRYPTVDLTASTVTVRLSPGQAVRKTPITCVVDFSAFDEPVGIEILGFEEQLGHKPPVDPTSRTQGEESVDAIPRWSYDADVDAFYLHLTNERAPRQREVLGSADLGQDGSILCFRVDLTE